MCVWTAKSGLRASSRLACHSQGLACCTEPVAKKRALLAEKKRLQNGLPRGRRCQVQLQQKPFHIERRFCGNFFGHQMKTKTGAKGESLKATGQLRAFFPTDTVDRCSTWAAALIALFAPLRQLAEARRATKGGTYQHLRLLLGI